MEKGASQKISEDILTFYAWSNGVEINWNFNLNENQCGRLKFIPLGEILESWEDRLYYDGADERLKKFRPVDIFVEEECCGIVLNGSGEETMYYHRFGEGEIYSLDLDFKGYFELGIEARWFLGWQFYIAELVNGEQAVTNPFEDGGMKEVFPDFDLDAFTQRFQELRLSGAGVNNPEKME